ncbi:hypothetical protein AGABI2DRAFT_195000, partial [Agaricus bisporus var. bisporus H97]|uniref:hypothetical protein n=1 Tax=Agaricus bisporus var. bisporus (strain H97 / ATCC MYA-4626 / FGSC 10389) TaxID=936046 RepID=UPI00029F57B5
MSSETLCSINPNVTSSWKTAYSSKYPSRHLISPKSNGIPDYSSINLPQQRQIYLMGGTHLAIMLDRASGKREKIKI